VCSRTLVNGETTSCVTQKCDKADAQGMSPHASRRYWTITLASIQVFADLKNGFCSAKSKDRTTQIREITWTFYAMAAVSVAFRLLARLVIMQGTKLGSDDWIMLVALACLTAFVVISEISTAVPLTLSVIIPDKHSESAWPRERRTVR